MALDEQAYISQFEIEGEDQVRQNISRGTYGAKGYAIAVAWLNKQAASREEQAQEESRYLRRQTQTAVIANQHSERQVQAAESANRLARDANRLSKWAIIISIVGCILAVIAILYDHA